MTGVVTVVVYAVLALIVVTVLVALAVLVLPGTEQLAPAPPDRTPWALPAERAMTGDDVGRLRLPVTLRGYRFAETDAVLDRLGEEIAYRDSVIATLRAELDQAEGGAAGEYLDDAPVVAADPSRWAPADGDQPVEERPVDEQPVEEQPVDEQPVELGETPEESEGAAAPSAGEPAGRERVVAIDEEPFDVDPPGEERGR